MKSNSFPIAEAASEMEAKSSSTEIDVESESELESGWTEIPSTVESALHVWVGDFTR
jgi:hypothetical protein